MDNKNSAPTREEMEPYFKDVNIGNRDFESYTKNSLLKICVGYDIGHTMSCILEELNLIKIKRNHKLREVRISVTDRGRASCYGWFKIQSAS